jgi:hypothetical protein
MTDENQNLGGESLPLPIIHEAPPAIETPPVATVQDIDYDRLGQSFANHIQQVGRQIESQRPTENGLGVLDQAEALRNAGRWRDADQLVLQQSRLDSERHMQALEQRLRQEMQQTYAPHVSTFAADNVTREVASDLPTNAQQFVKEQLAQLPPQQLAQLTANPALKAQLRYLAKGFAAENPMKTPVMPEGVNAGTPSLSNEEEEVLKRMQLEFPEVNLRDPKLIEEMRRTRR